MKGEHLRNIILTTLTSLSNERENQIFFRERLYSLVLRTHRDASGVAGVVVVPAVVPAHGPELAGARALASDAQEAAVARSHQEQQQQ